MIEIQMRQLASFLLTYYRRFFKDMQQVALDKKSNMEYLEKEIGLKRFLPKSIIDNVKVGILKVRTAFIVASRLFYYNHTW